MVLEIFFLDRGISNGLIPLRTPIRQVCLTWNRTAIRIIL